MQAAVFGHIIDFENAKTFDQGRFKDERPVNEYLHLEPQVVSRFVTGKNDRFNTGIISEASRTRGHMTRMQVLR